MTAPVPTLDPTITRHAGKILTVYLHTHQGDASNLNRGFETSLASELKDIERLISAPAEQAEFTAAASAIKNLVAGHKPKANSLVLFADATGVLLSREFHVEMPSGTHWGAPHIAPYLGALDEFERYTIVATDKSHARILTVFLGAVESTIEIRDNSRATHIHTAGTDHLESQSQFQRHADENASKHVRHIVRELETATQNRASGRIVIGGNVEAVSELFRTLPKRLRARVTGTLSLSMADSTEHLIKTAQQAQFDAERRFELDGVGRLLEAAGAGRKGVTGLRETLASLGERRILSLYYAEDLQILGKECVDCKALFPADAEEKCAQCGGLLNTSNELLDLILIKALETGAQIEQVRRSAAEKLRTAGSIGAFLRY